MSNPSEDTHVTLTGVRIDLSTLSDAERSVYERLIEDYGRRPSWDEFSCASHDTVQRMLSSVEPAARVEHPLHRARFDLDMRLGIAEGNVAKPDYRDTVYERIKEKFGTRYRFCKATGMSQAYLSQVLMSREKDFSLPKLDEVARALDLEVALVPAGEMPVCLADWLRREAIVVTAEMAHLESMRKRLSRLEADARLEALQGERLLFSELIDRLEEQLGGVAPDERSDRVLVLLESESKRREERLSTLRSRLAALAEEADAAVEGREGPHDRRTSMSRA